MVPLTFRKIFTYSPEKLIFLKDKFWIKSIFWDCFWFHSGIWISVILIIFKPSLFIEIFYAIGVFMFWIAHRFSSLYLAWGTKAFHPLCKKQPIRFVIFPFLIVIWVFIFIFFIPHYLLPFSILERIICLFLIDFFWGAHHFAAQHYGVLRIYQNVWKKESSKLSRIQDRFFCWGIGGIMVILAEILHGSSYLQEKNLIPFPISTWFFEKISLLKILGTLVVIGSTIYMIRNALFFKYGLPKVLYFLGIGIMVIAAFQLEPFQFLMLWTLQHWMVSLGLTSHMGGNDSLQNYDNEIVKSLNPSFLNFSKCSIVLLSLCFFSILMTPFFEIEAVSRNISYTEKFLPGLMEWLRKSDWVFFLMALGISSGFVHYWMDRAVYRLSDKETCKVAKILLFSK